MLPSLEVAKYSVGVGFIEKVWGRHSTPFVGLLEETLKSLIFFFLVTLSSLFGTFFSLFDSFVFWI